MSISPRANIPIMPLVSSTPYWPSMDSTIVYLWKMTWMLLGTYIFSSSQCIRLTWNSGLIGWFEIFQTWSRPFLFVHWATSAWWFAGVDWRQRPLGFSLLSSPSSVPRWAGIQQSVPLCLKGIEECCSSISMQNFRVSYEPTWPQAIDIVFPDSRTRLIDLGDCDLNSVSVQISRWTEGKYFAVQCQNFLWHHGGGGIASKVDVKRETGIEIQYLMIKGVPKCQEHSIKSIQMQARDIRLCGSDFSRTSKYVCSSQ